MKSIRIAVACGLLLLALPAVVRGQFTFFTNADNTITINGYTGTDANMVIPSTINLYPLTPIVWFAFDNTPYLPAVTIPESVTNIGWVAFGACSSLTNIDVNATNANYASVDGVLFRSEEHT